MKPREERVRAFLEDLTKLSKAHGIAIAADSIGGCINLYDLTDEELRGRYRYDPDELYSYITSNGIANSIAWQPE